ncbi:Flp/Fap pilin component [Roseovarius sp. THAF27]|uniref:Flp family type IVb pilin n=1 Tax=unclassified Roseovarius TaxID=2614913 RepID=UPI00126807B5|nr:MULTISPECIES: Flp family type IVb pilin [unclassified Roseovarius]QFT82043.1 Flp/Fap pilin component [Roseovarius sp. THAF27]QFT98925.1 Flp/Fap pilin component [Roseovarius sp. THAF8]
MTIARKSIQTLARTFARDEDGATAIEYGLFAALIGAVIIVTVSEVGTETHTGFTTMKTELQKANGTGSP